MENRKRSVKQIAYYQLKEFLAVFLYLWVVLALFAFHKSMILREQHIKYFAYGFAFVNALALSKVILVANELHLADNFKDKPLIYPTLLKSAAFAILLVCFHALEEIAVLLYHGKTFQESLLALSDRTDRELLSVGLLMFFVLIPFFGFTELSRLVGEGKLASVFFRSRKGQVMGQAVEPVSSRD